jgi:AraC family transcriptional regulator of adaptative response / DNA-3-methyladenine glycosylase II
MELAQTHRLLLAKCLLTDTPLPVTRVAFASGFQSLRRFNSVFRERYRMSPSMLRRQPRSVATRERAAGSAADLIRLTLAYRAPLAWDVLLQSLARDAMPEVELIEGRRYARTVSLEGCGGVVLVEDADSRRGGRSGHGAHVTVDVSVALLPVLMPLMARLRHLFDLDAEPAVIEAHLARAGLSALVRSRPGLRLPGAFDGFEAALRELLRASTRSTAALDAIKGYLVQDLGEPIESGIPGLTRVTPTAGRVAAAGPGRLSELGIPERQSEMIAAVAGAVTRHRIRLEPGADVGETLRVLRQQCGLDERSASAIVRRSLHWPDAFPPPDAMLRRAACAGSGGALLRMAERWRPWRAYAALHLAS